MLTKTCTLIQLGAFGQDAAAWTAALLKQHQASYCSALEIDCDHKPLPVGLVCALPATREQLGGTGCHLRLRNVSRETVQALHFVAQTDAIAERTYDAVDFPYRVSFHDKGLVVIEVDKSAASDNRLSSPASYQWLGGVHPAQIAVDLGALHQVNSVLVAWLLQLGQHIKPVPLELRRVNRQVAILFQQLRLNHLMTLNEAVG